MLFAPFGEKHLASTPEQIESLINKILAGIEKVNFSDRIASTEQSTIYMALEILLPHSERANVKKMLADGKAELDIAKAYLLPVQFLKIYLSEDYASLMDKAYQVADRRV